MPKNNSCIAVRARIMIAFRRFKLKLKNVGFSFLKTLGTKPVHWLGGVISYLVRIHKSTQSDFLKFILRLGLGPVFKVHNFLCKIVFLYLQFMSFRQHQRCLKLYGDEYLKDFGNALVSINIGLKSAYTQCDIISRLR